MDYNSLNLLVNYWIHQPSVNLNDDAKWKEVQALLKETQKTKPRISHLKKVWILEIDRELAELSRELGKKQDFFKWKAGQPLEEKLLICSKRLEHVRQVRQEFIMAGGVEDEQIVTTEGNESVSAPSLTSAVATWIVPMRSVTSAARAAANKRKSLVLAENESQIMKRSKLIPKWETACIFSECNVHCLQLATSVPSMFVSSDQGAQSIDVSGWRMPRPYFAGSSFFVLMAMGNYADVASAISHEFFIQIHGGTLLLKIEDVTPETFVIASLSDSLNRDVFHRIESNIVVSAGIYNYVKKSAFRPMKKFSIEDVTDYVYWPDSASTSYRIHGSSKSCLSDEVSSSDCTTESTGTSLCTNGNGNEQKIREDANGTIAAIRSDPTSSSDDSEEQVKIIELKPDCKAVTSKLASTSFAVSSLDEMLYWKDRMNNAKAKMTRALVFVKSGLNTLENIRNAMDKTYTFIFNEPAPPGYIEAAIDCVISDIKGQFEELKEKFSLSMKNRQELEDLVQGKKKLY